jgi:hypothetical protein
MVLVAKLKQIFLSLLKSEGCRNFVIHVQLNRLENNVAQSIYHVAEPVYKITSTVYQSPSLIHQLPIVAAHVYKISHVVDFEVTHDVGQLEIRNFFFRFKHLLHLLLSFFFLWRAFIGAGDVLNDVGNQTLGEAVVNFSFFLN